ncbi:MAG: outer membrane protein assembly factor BamB family protein [Candidatus Helarchaeota archaeon]
MNKLVKIGFLSGFILSLALIQVIIPSVKAIPSHYFNWSYSTGDDVESVAISGDGQYIVAGSYDNKVYLFQRNNSTPLWAYSTGSNVWSVAISGDGQYIVAGSCDNKVYLFQRNSSTPLWAYSTGSNVESVAISGDGQYIVAGSYYSEVYLFQRNSSTPLWAYSTGSYVESVAISGDGQYIVAGTFYYFYYNFYYIYHGEVYLFQRNSSTPLWAYSTGDGVESVAISGDGQYIVAGSRNNEVYLFDSKDTDGDGLSDGYETFISNTDPNNEDSDGDVFSDGWEVQNGYNPLSSFSNPKARIMVLVIIIISGVSAGVIYFRKEIRSKIHYKRLKLRQKKQEREKAKLDTIIGQLFMENSNYIKDASLLIQEARYIKAIEKLQVAIQVLNRIQSFIKKKEIEKLFAEKYRQLNQEKIEKLMTEIDLLNKKCVPHILQINNRTFEIKDKEGFLGRKIILKNILAFAPALDIENFLKNKERYEKWGKLILRFKSENNRFPTKKEIWQLGIPMDRIEDVIQFLNLPITTEILPDLENEERTYFDMLSQKVIIYFTAHKLDALRIEELVLNLNLKVRDAKILIPFINEVLEHVIKIKIEI